MKHETLYTIVVVAPNGGQNMNFFTKEKDAIADAKRVEEAMKEGGVEGYSVYLSELDYCVGRNLIVSDEFITDESRLLYNGQPRRKGEGGIYNEKDHEETGV